MFNREPVAIINGLTELIRQLLPLMVIVGVFSIPQDKLNAWNLIISLTLTFISTTILRSSVVSPKTANEQIQIAIDAPKGSTTVEEVIETQKEKENEEPAKNI